MLRSRFEVAIRRNKVVRFKQTDRSIARKEWKEVEDVFPHELSCHEEYRRDFLAIEREREERSPRLSANFLTEHVNVDQRRLVVVFLLHIGVSSRRRVPSGRFVHVLVTVRRCIVGIRRTSCTNR